MLFFLLMCEPLVGFLQKIVVRNWE